MLNLRKIRIRIRLGSVRLTGFRKRKQNGENS